MSESAFHVNKIPESLTFLENEIGLQHSSVGFYMTYLDHLGDRGLKAIMSMAHHTLQIK